MIWRKIVRMGQMRKTVKMNLANPSLFVMQTLISCVMTFVFLQPGDVMVTLIVLIIQMKRLVKH